MYKSKSQHKLMELVVDKVLREYGVIDNTLLRQEEKEKIADIVEDIIDDVEKFLENEIKVDNSNEKIEKETKVFSSPNNIKSVKIFLSKNID